MNDREILGLLVGEWTGAGRGEFPTIDPFEYLETLRFTSDDRPFLHYEQKTQRRSAGQTDYVPSHWESGFMRLLSDGSLELINAQSGGRLELMIGSLESTKAGLSLRFKSAAFFNDPRMLESSRAITVEGDTLHYILNMGTTAVPQSVHHVEATLKRKK